MAIVRPPPLGLIGRAGSGASPRGIRASSGQHTDPTGPVGSSKILGTAGSGPAGSSKFLGTVDTDPAGKALNGYGFGLGSVPWSVPGACAVLVLQQYVSKCAPMRRRRDFRAMTAGVLCEASSVCTRAAMYGAAVCCALRDCVGLWAKFSFAVIRES